MSYTRGVDRRVERVAKRKRDNPFKRTIHLRDRSATHTRCGLQTTNVYSVQRMDLHHVNCVNCHAALAKNAEVVEAMTKC